VAEVVDNSGGEGALGPLEVEAMSTEDIEDSA
jgi:hypothetical protein